MFASRDAAPPEASRPVLAPAPPRGAARYRGWWKPPALALYTVIVGVTVYVISKARNEEHQPPPAPTESVTAPLSLSGLGFLPPDCNIVFAVQPGPLLVYAQRTNQDPVQILTRNCVPASFLGSLAKAGITLQQIDHIAGGVYVPGQGEEIRLGFVLVLRQPADETQFLDALHAKRVGEKHYEVQFDAASLHLHKVTETIWAFGLSAKDWAGNTALSPSVQSLVRDRLAKDAAIWVAIGESDWVKKPLAKWTGQEDRLARYRAAAIGYSFDETPQLRLDVLSSDEKSAGKLRSFFQSQATGEHSAAGGRENWAALQKPTDPAEIFTTLKTLIDEAGR
jgi:hypothetical protein